MEVDTESLVEASDISQQVGSHPLALDLSKRCSLLLQDLGIASGSKPRLPIDVAQVIFDYAFNLNDGLSAAALLEALSGLLAVEGVSGSVIRSFGPILPDLLARWLENTETLSAETWEARLVTVSSLAALRPDLWSVVYSFISISPFCRSPLTLLTGQSNLQTERIHRILLAYLRLLIADPNIATRLEWSTTPLLQLRNHTDTGVKLLCILVIAKQQDLSEEKRMELENKWIGDVSACDAAVHYGKEVVLVDGGCEFKDRWVDGWLLPVHEARREAEFYSLAPIVDDVSSATIAMTDLCSRSIVLGDRLCLTNTSEASAETFIHVSTASSNTALSQIVPAIQLGLPIMLSSSPSSGKTHILQYLCTQIYPSSQPTHRILTIPLADTSIDVKSLIGTYISSTTKPGTFEWMEGVLTKALRAGRWVVFDDIDRASTEMLVTIAGITRSLRPGRHGRRAELPIPGRGKVEAGDGFAIFATRSTSLEAFSPAIFLGHQEFREVVLEAPTDSDIFEILSARYASLPAEIITPLVSIWQRLRPLAKISGQVKARSIGLRDLEKWCGRIEKSNPPAPTAAGPFFNPAFQDEIMLEAADIFIASLDTKPSSLDKRMKMLRAVAEGINMDEERALSLMDRRKPTLELAPSSRRLLIGRTTTPTAAPEKRRSAPAPSRPFALTKPSLVLLERVAAAIATAEPLLLVGETGTGKTTAVQYIADTCRKPLTALNLSMQTESSDLLGGFKPIDASVAARSIHATWQHLFCESFSMGKSTNGAYVEATAKALGGRKWARCAELWSTSAKRAVDKLSPPEQTENGGDSPRKRRKVVNAKAAKLAVQWQSLLVEVADFDLHHVKMKSKLVFSFVEGPLVKALVSGEWILLDEVNLASQETLEAIATILEGSSSSLVLTERGDVEPLKRHPDFRLFACMNPATDVGKKDLPPNLRNRFTELYVPPPDDDREALITIVSQYINDAAAGDKGVILDVVEMYTTLKSLSAKKEIVDGSNVAPHFSMRTLARALVFATDSAPLFGLRRGLWEGCLMAFTMSLDLASAKKAHEVCERHLLTPMKNARAVLGQIPSLPSNADADDYIRFGPFWLRRGPLPPDTNDSRYVITPSVQAKLSDLARVILTHRYPVLIQGPTSAGKTSAVEFLARQTGHRFVRINNHEHTDIQEYLGTYVTDSKTGNLVFQEGLLVTAIRQGHWIVLDELNLAPTDVLEALNRLLDDNRELVIPETQEVIRPHPNFILFATQNPPGLYAGRKVLSRAFRNRFLEVHFDDVPKDELETILCQRCQIAPPYAKKIVQVFEELRHRRQATRVFESKSSFATLRDLFRWAERGAVGYQQLAEDGYMLLAERARQNEDKIVIKKVIEDIMKVSVDETRIYRVVENPTESILGRLPFDDMPESTLVWTRAMQRLFSLVAFALAHNEPVLLVGETGCGKTSVCEIIARAFNQQLVGVNCHQNMETADLLGSQRPVRNRHERKAKVIATLSQHMSVDPAATDDEIMAACDSLRKQPEIDSSIIKACQSELKALNALFEWSDGPLVHAMAAGDLLLLDEVSLADDSVLERLNSVLEPGRTLVLAEKGGVEIDEATLKAHDSFHVVATMNPGGDFGKKELSPALRNRFTEIWVPPLDDRQDLLQIIDSTWKHDELRVCGERILDFFGWFGQRIGDTAGMGLRDILAWVTFSNSIYGQGVRQVTEAFHHGGQMILIDGLESLSQVGGQSAASVAVLRKDCLDRLDTLATSLGGHAPVVDLAVSTDAWALSIGGFGIPRGPFEVIDTSAFRFEAPTTALNAMRVLRGCQLPKAILLEGSPGVGKTSLVSALAAVSGHRLQRINLSDQTDLIDLFGSDLPVEGGQAGEFQWRDAAFLDAMQKGDWVLLDEMNLASQTVLEGLNAVLDHRGTVFIPELGRSFERHPDFRVFAAQNPLQQGGGRKGLPKSFLNRFTKVYLQEHTPEDLLMICRQLYPGDEEIVQKMITFNEIIRDSTMVSRTIGREGSPWEFNLRDLFRWFKLLSSRNGLEASEHPVEYLRLIYTQRFRNEKDRRAVLDAFVRIFGVQDDSPRPQATITPSHYQIGHSLVKRSGSTAVNNSIIHQQLDLAESVLKCVEMGWLVILSGESGSGKRGLLKAIADGAGRSLGEFAMHPGVDTSEILGSFEQQDLGRLVDGVIHAISTIGKDQLETSAERSTVLEQLRKSAANVKAKPDDDERLNAFVSLARQYLDASGNDTQATAVLDHLVKTGTSATGFAWNDGELLTTIRNGGWFLLSNANLCSPSVLDRLNSLCESNGVLVLSEKGSSTGSPEIITPHPDFRLFMTYDPRHGELSRAMRNRGVELSVEKPMEVLKQTASAAFADQSLLRSLVLADRHQDGSASDLANLIVSQPARSGALLDRYGRLTDARPAYEAALAFLTSSTMSTYRQTVTAIMPDVLPLDPSINANIKTTTPYAIFSSVQLLLRNLARISELQEWMKLPKNAKSILTLSSRAASGRTRVKMAGSELWGLISGIRTLLQEQLSAILGFSDGSVSTLRTDALESLSILLTLLEKRNSGDVFDYSATQLLAEWIKSSISTVPALASVTDQLDSLAKTVTLETGKGQAQIWSMFRDGSTGPLDDEATLLERLQSITDHRLKMSVAQAIAAVQIDNEEEVASLKQMILSLEPGQVGAMPTKWTLRSLLGPIELEALARGSNEAVQLLLLDRQASPLTAATLLSAARQTARPAVFFRAISDITSTLWDAGDLEQKNSTGEGLAKLFTPSRLVSVLRFGSDTSVTLNDLSQEQDAFKFTIDMVLWSTRHTIEARSALVQTLGRSISMMCATFGNQVEVTGSLTALVQATASLPDSILKDGLERHILPYVHGDMKSLASIGKAWTGFSRFMIELYVTNIPIDPAVRRVLLGDVIATRLQLLEEELSTIEQAEVELKGISDSHRRENLLERLRNVALDKDNLGPTVSRSTEASRLAILFNEVHSFIDDAFSPSAFDGLLQALEAGHAQALLREEGFQISSAAFIARLSQYTDLDDLVTPIRFAVESAKLGVRILARDLTLKSKSPSTSVTNAMRFPVSSALSTFAQPESSSQMTKAALRDQFLAATALSADSITPNQRIRQVPLLVDTFDQLYLSWSEIRQREQQDEQASESLYRVKKTDIEVLSDEELEEQEFARMFPTYDEEDSEDTPFAAPVVKDEKIRFDHDSVLSFHQLFMSAFGSNKTAIDFKSAVDKLLASDFDPSAYDELLDNRSLPLQIRHLHERMLSLQPAKSHPNFYIEANEPEVRKARALILRLIARLDQLIEDWPEQMVPQHIKDRCEAILLLHTRSPVARVLTSLEQLLLHTNDWEGYANKENSLASYQAEISDQIVSWRRLELSSWMRLLDDQVIEYSNNDAEWTMRLFGALVQGVQTAEDVSKHLQATLPMISSYLSASSLGHFASRVETLKAMANMADEMVNIDKNSSFKQTSALLHNVVANASLFMSRLNDSLHTQRAIIDKAIKDFVKLASWKDVNVYALKASAVKSHRQLHRNVRKFREVLRQPVAPILMDHNSICPQEPPSAAPRGSIPPLFTISAISTEAINARSAIEPAAPAHLVRLEDTLKRYHTVHEKARSTLQTSAADSLDEMAVEIIETAAELAKATPESLTKENTKLVNNLASRKRKAYSDLLKALRASGFSNSVRADQLAKQQSSTSMSTLARLPVLPDGLDDGDIKRVESYHHRLNVLMITLRAAFNGHNPDIASQDLERGIGYAESVFAAALVERQKLSTDLGSFVRLIELVKRLDHFSIATTLRGGKSVQQRSIDAEMDLVKLVRAIDEVAEGIAQMKDLDSSITFDGSAKLQEHRDRLSALLTSAEKVNTVIRRTDAALYTADELTLLSDILQEKTALSGSLGNWAQSNIQFRHLTVPVLEIVSKMIVSVPEASRDDLSSAVWNESDDLIQSMLVLTQGIKTDSVELKDDEPVHVPTEFKSLNALSTSLRVSGILEKFSNFMDRLSSTDSVCSSSVISRVLPFVQDLAESYSHAISARSYTLKSTYKLGYVVSRLVLDLAQKGFCKPQEQSDSKDDQGGETVDGTGMGSGTGDKNVSSEIEEESQVEGLQGEKEEEGQEKDEENEDDAVSMDNDFEGELGDAKQDENDEEGSEGDEEEKDDHVGDVDPLDPGAVDEKFWGDEDEKEEQKNDGKEDLVNQKDEGGDSEMAAKESEGEKKDDKDKKKEDQKDGEQQDAPQDNGEEGQDLDDFDQDQDETNEDDEGDAQGEEQAEGGIQDQDDVVAPEGDRLDLPEDMDLGGDEEDDKGDGEEIDDLSMKGDDEGEEVEPSDNGQASDDDGAEENDAPAPTGATEEEANEPDDTLNPNVDTSAANDNQAQQSAEAGAGLDGGDDKQGQDKEDVEMAEKEAPTAGEGAAPQDQHGASTAEQPEGDGPIDSAGAPMPASANDRSDRSLGDILQEIQRRREEILAQQERENETNDPAAPDQAPGQVEYLHEGDQDEGMQALGAAGEEERQRLEDLNIVDEEQKESEELANMDDSDEAEPTKVQGREADATVKTEAETDHQTMEKALTQSEVRGNGPDASKDEPDLDMDVDMEDVLASAEFKDEEDEEIEIDIKEGEGVVGTNNDGEDLWRKYANLTSDLSYALCEQLRLILEPTLATRLQGDFRTGKRLNMRKIIPYIASEYTKDKIWLRRTKPSRREYQVLLSLDDSRSMAESHSVNLAYQTLALVSQALNKLEVGQISIARFGESVDILHPFGDTGFTDVDGAKVMDSFKFDQHRTDVAALVEKSLTFLAEARQRQASSSSAPDLWQLQVIISDGVCQDHHKLRTLLRRALEERVMIVFVIVDSLHRSQSTPQAGGASSILSMQTVEYKEVNGTMQLEMQRYLDTFPFEFYVVLRDVEALPGVLADTLRQWMTRVSQSNE